MIELKTQVIQEINNQILLLSNPETNLNHENTQVEKDMKIKILSEMEALEEGFLMIRKENQKN